MTAPDPLADDLSRCRLLDTAGEPVRAGDLWRDGPVVLVFLRHFG
jgi:hypothetical protein